MIALLLEMSPWLLALEKTGFIVRMLQLKKRKSGTFHRRLSGVQSRVGRQA